MQDSRAPGAKFLVWKIYATGAAICAAVGAASYFAGVRPAVARHADAEAKQTELAAAKQKASGLIGTLNKSRGQLAAVNEALANVPLRLEAPSAVNQRLARLTALANASGLAIDEMRHGATSDGPDHQTVPILIAGNGTYPACARFLHELSRQFPDTAVRSFQTTNNSASLDSPAATFEFELAWHVAKG